MQYKLIPLIIGQVFIKADGSSYHFQLFEFNYDMFTMLLVSRVDLFLYVNKSDMKCTTDVDSNEICLFEPCSETRLTIQLWIMLVFLLQKVKV